MEERLKSFLYLLIAENGSDIHLQAGGKVHIRVQGELKAVTDEVMSNEDIVGIAREILTTPQYHELSEKKELDCSYTLDGSRRFRVNFFYQVDGLSVVMRAIPPEIRSIDALSLPPVVNEFADLSHGLVLVTGVTGSGKSTTMAALLDRINKSRRKHIISIEDPVEFIHANEQCLVSQRAIGTNTDSFANALRAAMREDIDVIFIGELRDLETMQIALHAANTGHLVFSTLHTLDAKETISRIVGMFPKEEQSRVRMTLSFLLEGIISQRLVKNTEGELIPAVEILKKTKRVSELIADNRDDEILEAIEKGKEIYGSQSFDQSLLSLYQEGMISHDEALKHATSPSDLHLRMEGIGQGTGRESAEMIRQKRAGFFDLKRQ
jgi:twitching motility protein PilT